ncbi:unnamed protein product [Ectocarpus sp. CCAP 1310/34]|nr:unnamed protein product [Ectocarpus sp. CCAP 1310/34]
MCGLPPPPESTGPPAPTASKARIRRRRRRWVAASLVDTSRVASDEMRESLSIIANRPRWWWRAALPPDDGCCRSSTNLTPSPRVRPFTVVSSRPNSLTARFESGGCGGAGATALAGCGGGGGGGRPCSERSGVAGADDGATEIGDGVEDPVKIGEEEGGGGAVVAGAGEVYVYVLADLGGGGVAAAGGTAAAGEGAAVTETPPPDARHRRRRCCSRVDPRDVVGEGEAPGVSAKNDGGGRRVVVGAVQVEAPRRLDVRLGGPLHAHHPFLEKRDDGEGRLPAEERLARRHPAPVGLRRGAIKAGGCPQRRSELQAMSVDADVGDGGEVDVADGEGVAARGVAPLHGAPNGALNHRVLLGGVGGGVLASNASSVAERGERGAGELAAVVHAETPWSAHAVHVGEEGQNVLQGVALGPHSVPPLPPRRAVHEHDQVPGASSASENGPVRSM